MATFTTEMNLEKPSEGASNAGESVNDNSDKIDAGRTYKLTLAEDIDKGEWARIDASNEAVLAQADSETNSIVIGVCTEDGLDGADRYFRYNGTITKTSWGLTPNTRYYLSATTAGAMTTTKPSSPNIVVELGQSDSTGDKFYIQIRVYLETTPGTQPVFKTIEGDTGSAVADSADDTLTISGGNGIVTSVPSEDNLQIGLTTLSSDWDAGDTYKIIVDTINVDVIEADSSSYIRINDDVELYQSADNQGFKIYGYDDEVTSYVQFLINSAGQTIINTNDVLSINSGGHTYLQSGYNVAYNLYFDSAGIFYWRDLDTGVALRMSLDSATGDLYVLGDIELDEILKVDTIEANDATEITINDDFDLVDNVILRIGYIELDEITTPTPKADYAKVYTKTDNILYFQDGAGTEHSIDMDGSGGGGAVYWDVLVAPSGGDYTSIATACSTEAKGTIIAVASGTYTETSAVTIKEGQVLTGLAGQISDDTDSPVVIHMGDYQVNVGESSQTNGCILRGMKFTFTPTTIHRGMYVPNNDNVIIEDIYVEFLGTQTCQGIEIYGCLDGRFSNITFKGNGYNYWALYVNTSSYCSFDNIKISNTRNQSGYLDSIYISASNYNNFNNITMDNFQATSWTTGNSNAITELSTCTANIFRNIYIHGNDKVDDGMFLAGRDTLATGLRIQGCIHGVHVQSGTDASQKISDFWIYDCWYIGIWLQQNLGSDIFISDGRIEACGDGTLLTRGGISNGGSYSGDKCRITNVQIQQTPANCNDIYLYNEENMLANVSCDGNVYIIGDDNKLTNCWIDGTLEFNALSERTELTNVHYGTLTDNGTFLKEDVLVHRSTSAPTVNDDITDGFKIGHQWIKTDTKQVYICMDNTATSADWDELLAGIPTHASTHENTGGDEINVAGLSGVLADDQNAIPEDGIDTSAIHDNVSAEISAIATEKTAVVSGDWLIGEDSENSNSKVKIQAGNIPATPSAHDLGGSQHIADTLADLISKISDATKLISSQSDEFDSFSALSIDGVDKLLAEDTGSSSAKRYTTFTALLAWLRTNVGLTDMAVGSYSGNNANNRTIATGITFDVAFVFWSTARTNTQNHGCMAWYVNTGYGCFFNNGSSNCMRSQVGTSATTRFQGKNSTQNLYLGSTGNLDTGFNLSGWFYTWLAIDLS